MTTADIRIPTERRCDSRFVAAIRVTTDSAGWFGNGSKLRRRSWLAGAILATMPHSSLDAAPASGLYRPQAETTREVKSDPGIFDNLFGKSTSKGNSDPTVDKSKDQEKRVAWCNAAGVKVTTGKSEQIVFMTVVLPVRGNVNEQIMLQQMQRILRQSSVAMTGRGQCVFVLDKKEQIDQLKQQRLNFVQVMQARKIEVVELYASNFPPNLLGDSPTRSR